MAIKAIFIPGTFSGRVAADPECVPAAGMQLYRLVTAFQQCVWGDISEFFSGLWPASPGCLGVHISAQHGAGSYDFRVLIFGAMP